MRLVPVARIGVIFVYDSITSHWMAVFSVVSVSACVVAAWWWSSKRSSIGRCGGVMLCSCLHALSLFDILIGCCCDVV